MLGDDQHKKKEAVIERLIARADTQGFLTLEDLMASFPDIDDDFEHLRAVIDLLHQQGVDILDSDANVITEDINLEGAAVVGRALDLDGSEDTVGLYLKEMSQVPLLTMEEEQLLAKRIEAGRSARFEIRKLESETDPECGEQLKRLVRDGDQSWEHLIKANTRLVVSIAKRYIGRGVPFLDLIQEGNLGLIKAVQKFDYRARLSLFHLCHLVDPPIDHTLNRRPGANDPYPGSHD
jgi:RNA polymerase primary sigma factor